MHSHFSASEPSPTLLRDGSSQMTDKSAGCGGEWPAEARAVDLDVGPGPRFGELRFHRDSFRFFLRLQRFGQAIERPPVFGEASEIFAIYLFGLSKTSSFHEVRA